MKLSAAEYANVLALQKYQKYKWFQEIVRLNEGQSFGELALLNDRPRAATI